MNVGTKTIKQAQKESLLLREISRLFFQAASDDSNLQHLSISRVALSPDKGICSIYFYTVGGRTEFDKALETLKLYKPSLRSALAKSIKSRYTPQLVFKFDEQYEKEEKMQKLLDSLKVKDEL